MTTRTTDLGNSASEFVALAAALLRDDTDGAQALVDAIPNRSAALKLVLAGATLFGNSFAGENWSKAAAAEMLTTVLVDRAGRTQPEETP